MSKATNKFSPEVRAHAARMVLDHKAEHPSRWQAILSIATKIGCSAHSLSEWRKKAEVDAGKRAGVTTDMSAKLKVLERENRELRHHGEHRELIAGGGLLRVLPELQGAQCPDDHVAPLQGRAEAYAVGSAPLGRCVRDERCRKRTDLPEKRDSGPVRDLGGVPAGGDQGMERSAVVEERDEAVPQAARAREDMDHRFEPPRQGQGFRQHLGNLADARKNQVAVGQWD